MGEGQGGGHGVLVVDDNPGDRRFIAEALESSDLDLIVHTVKTREDALDMLSRQGDGEGVPELDVILLDWNLSQETGEAVVTAAKSGGTSISVVVMSGSESVMEDVSSTVTQADTYIEKPTHPDEYTELVRSLLPDHR